MSRPDTEAAPLLNADIADEAVLLARSSTIR